MAQTPSIGRIVHYGKRKTATPSAAIITAVHSATCVDLTVFPAGAPPIAVSRVQHGDVDGADPVWAWPRFVPETTSPAKRVPASDDPAHDAPAFTPKSAPKSQKPAEAVKSEPAPKREPAQPVAESPAKQEAAQAEAAPAQTEQEAASSQQDLEPSHLQP